MINGRKALLVMDMQEICVGENRARFFKYDKDIVKKVNEVIKRNDNIVYIRTLLKNNIISRLLPIHILDKNKGARLADNLLIKSSLVFDKYQGDAFSNPILSEYLNKNGIDTLEIVGIDGGGCVSSTAFGAIKNGYKVILNTKAIDTMFKMRSARRYNTLKKKGAIILK